MQRAGLALAIVAQKNLCPLVSGVCEHFTSCLFPDAVGRGPTSVTETSLYSWTSSLGLSAHASYTPGFVVFDRRCRRAIWTVVPQHEPPFDCAVEILLLTYTFVLCVSGGWMRIPAV